MPVGAAAIKFETICYLLPYLLQGRQGIFWVRRRGQRTPNYYDITTRPPGICATTGERKVYAHLPFSPFSPLPPITAHCRPLCPLCAHCAHYGPLWPIMPIMPIMARCAVCPLCIVRIAARYAPLAGPLPNSQALFCLFVSFYTPWVGGT
jgi:hypothetical protein